jgi:hypothetical protein
LITASRHHHHRFHAMLPNADRLWWCAAPDPSSSFLAVAVDNDAPDDDQWDNIASRG